MKIEFAGEIYNVDEIAQYETIPYSKALSCECGHCSVMNHNAIIRGYCSTSVGYMLVFDCEKCNDIYRHHINTTGRYDIDKFKGDVGLMMYCQNNK